VLAAELQASRRRHPRRDEKRLEAIALLREFLAGEPEGPTRADGMFKLPVPVGGGPPHLPHRDGRLHERELERCKQGADACATQPVEPRIQLGESEGLYKDLIDLYPTTAARSGPLPDRLPSAF